MKTLTVELDPYIAERLRVEAGLQGRWCKTLAAEAIKGYLSACEYTRDLKRRNRDEYVNGRCVGEKR